MMGRTHLAIGVLLLFFLSRYTSWVGNELYAAVVILVASVLPDIDHAQSLLGRKVKIVSWIFRHRGFFHSIFAMVAFTVVVQLLFLGRGLSLVFMTGYAGHLFADSVTREGTRLFYPRKLVTRGPLRVGSFAETMIIFLLVVLTVYLIV